MSSASRLARRRLVATDGPQATMTTATDDDRISTIFDRLILKHAWQRFSPARGPVWGHKSGSAPAPAQRLTVELPLLALAACYRHRESVAGRATPAVGRSVGRLAGWPIGTPLTHPPHPRPTNLRPRHRWRAMPHAGGACAAQRRGGRFSTLLWKPRRLDLRSSHPVRGAAMMSALDSPRRPSCLSTTAKRSLPC